MMGFLKLRILSHDALIFLKNKVFVRLIKINERKAAQSLFITKELMSLGWTTEAGGFPSNNNINNITLRRRGDLTLRITINISENNVSCVEWKCRILEKHENNP